MYLVPFSMGPIGGQLSKNGVELTDSAYVAVSMRVMTRIGNAVLDCIRDQGEFIKCLHSVGRPLEDGAEDDAWPCNPEKVLIAHRPATNDILSFGSGYGGNSLLGKKCFALRIGSALAKKEVLIECFSLTFKILCSNIFSKDCNFPYSKYIACFLKKYVFF